MSLTRENANRLAVAVVETLLELPPEDGVPESFPCVAAESEGLCSLMEAAEVIGLLVESGLFRRLPGPRIGRGPKFAAVAEHLATLRARQARTP